MADDRQAPHLSPQTTRGPRWARGLACAALSGVFVVTSLATGQPMAVAEPDSVAQAQKKVETLQAEAARLQEDYTRTQAKLDETEKALATTKSDLAATRERVEKSRAAMMRVALGSYQGGAGLSPTTKVVTSSDPDQFLSTLTTMQNVSDRQNSQLRQFQNDQADLAGLERKLADQEKTIRASRDAKARLKKDADSRTAQAQQVVDRLDAEQKARLAAAQQAQAAEQLAAATARDGAPTQTSRSGADRTASPSASASDGSTSAPAPAASGRGGSAVSFALAQVGKAYVYGATGPSGYDCSGLMLRAWANAGVSLPRTSSAQFGVGTSVPVSQLQPGDLVFYYSGISHVGMYIGNGKIVHAANPRSGVTVAPLMSMPYQGARRVG